VQSLPLRDASPLPNKHLFSPVSGPCEDFDRQVSQILIHPNRWLEQAPALREVIRTEGVYSLRTISKIYVSGDHGAPKKVA